MTESTQATNQPNLNQVYVPRGWSEPTHQPGDHIWHDCYEYEVTGAAPNHPWELWSYTVIPVGHSHKPDYM